MHIGELAKRSGVSPATIRHYERVGLLPHADRTPGGYRMYGDSSVERVRLIQNALRFGFSLRQLSAFLRVRHAGGTPCRNVRAAGAQILEAVYIVLSTVVMFVTPHPEDFDLQNGFFSNPGAFMDPMTSHKFLRVLASNLDVFVIWTLLLLATGLKAAGGKKLSFSGALFAVVLPFAVYVLIRGGLAAAGLGG